MDTVTATATRTTAGPQDPPAPAGAEPERPAGGRRWPWRRDAGADRPIDPKDLRPLPLWFFGFEAFLASAWDLCHAEPRLVYVVGALVVANIVVTLTVLRSRVRIAKRLWRGKSTRKTALALLALRLGSHVVLHAAGAAITSPAAHYAFAAVMAAVTLVLLWYTQRTALRALAREFAAAPAVPAAAAATA